MNCQKAKELDLFNYLIQQGFKSQKLTNNSAWFLSPFRIEKTPSFMVDFSRNTWFDFGEGFGGNIIDLVIKLNQCSIKEALAILSGDKFSFHQQTRIIDTKPKYQILKEVKLENPYLIDYLIERKINVQLAKKYCSEIHYSFDSIKKYFAVGFKNDLNGHELRNKYFKGCFGKKAITHFNNQSEQVLVFEGFIDFLSYLTINKNVKNKSEDYLILNSLTLLKKSKSILSNYSEAILFLDNDKSGKQASNYLKKELKAVIDKSSFYNNYKDLNDYLINFNIARKNKIIGY